ncbi:histone-lysine N-methyltransferase SETMAR [Trichonephila clavipes]|uniref:Histone-lysine N-methyltransferase SETMAR n=1 Tax=Trichonephila clavipes TaxID=2585209 RepID=A0A8X6S4P7_TRICX|nr:histone-lysine N-methyltransferase SETMAR [Trichonephila clavipes]
MLTKGVRFHHDNARPHTANRTTALVERFGWEMVSHPPYSPDLAPSDFHLFPELKKTLAEPNSRQMKRCKTRLLIFYTDRRQKEFGTVIEDDDDINVHSEKELSLEQKLELVITEKMSADQNTTQKSEIDLFED